MTDDLRSVAEDMATIARRALTAIEAGEMTAGPVAVSYLHGALAALDALLGRRQLDLDDLPT